MWRCVVPNHESFELVELIVGCAPLCSNAIKITIDSTFDTNFITPHLHTTEHKTEKH